MQGVAQVATNQITPPNSDRPFVEDDLTLTVQNRSWADLVTLSIPIIGTGSPEGIVEAPVRQLYMDDAGTTSTILYIKRDTDDGVAPTPDKTKGWILI